MIPDNVARFSDPETVAGYSGTPSLQGGEEYLFGRYLKKGAAILDLGVGGGRTTPYLVPLAGRYVGIDLSRAMVDAARNAFPDVDFRHMDASDLSGFPDRTFDVAVFSYNGLGFVVPDAGRLKCLSECARVLKHDGVLILSLHNARSIFVRPGRKGPGAAGIFRGIYSGLIDNCVRLFTRVATATFWRGAGWYTTSAHGGLRVFAATPERVVREAEKAGFRLMEVVAEDYPRANLPLVTRWYYYAFVRSNELSRDNE